MGTHKGFVQIWDAGAQKRLTALEGHSARVGKDLVSHLVEQSSYSTCTSCKGVLL